MSTLLYTKAHVVQANLLREEKYNKIRSSSTHGCNSSGRSTLDLVVPWGASRLDIQDSSLLVPMFQQVRLSEHSDRASETIAAAPLLESEAH